MPDRSSDHLANERTFLAWIRTSVSIIVFGFVVAKFGITLRQLFHLEGRAPQESGLSLGLGIGFMVVGVFMAVLALFRYRSTRERLESGEFRPAGKLITAVGVTTAILGVLLAAYLLFTARTL